MAKKGILQTAERKGEYEKNCRKSGTEVNNPGTKAFMPEFNV